MFRESIFSRQALNRSTLARKERSSLNGKEVALEPIRLSKYATI